MRRPTWTFYYIPVSAHFLLSVFPSSRVFDVPCFFRPACHLLTVCSTGQWINDGECRFACVRVVAAASGQQYSAWSHSRRHCLADHVGALSIMSSCWPALCRRPILCFNFSNALLALCHWPSPVRHCCCCCYCCRCCVCMAHRCVFLTGIRRYASSACRVYDHAHREI